ncbi:MAG: TrkH family potassium uptake protein [Paludibacter sp.]|jgi:trk system potassium uptake protein TrkH|nr:TrkH family potassium uptake protein [Paludibacter sp.]
MFHNLNHKLILRITGSLLLFEGLFLLLSSFVAFIYKEDVLYHFLIATGVSGALGVLFYLVGKNASEEIGKREGSIVVTSIWLVFTFIGLLPYWLGGYIPSFTDAFFETMSGFTTTGASILTDVESLPHSLLFWRSLTHWIGGLGIIVISIALLPIFGFSAAQLFLAEATGPTQDKIHPRTTEVAKRLLGIYLILTLTEMLLLVAAGMDWFDAINHSFSTIATGGFSTKRASIAYWSSPAIQYIIILFMFLGGVNFPLFYFLIKGKFNKIKENEELHFFIFIILAFTLLIGIATFDFTHLSSGANYESTFRNSLFTVMSVITTTGFSTVDYMNFAPFVWLLLMILMVTGSSAGSTAGGVKLIRVHIAMKFIYFRIKKIVHPNAVFPIKYNNQIMKNDIIMRVLAFILLYIVLIVVGSVILAASGMGFLESIGGMISCMGNVGVAFGEFGPSIGFSGLSVFAKWFLSAMMLIGRLELFTVFVLFTPIFWRK